MKRKTKRTQRKITHNSWQLLTSYKDKLLWIKQSVVTNCSKERPGSIVIKTLKNGILIPIAISKELYFNADPKYISLIKFSLTYQKLRAREIFTYFRK